MPEKQPFYDGSICVEYYDTDPDLPEYRPFPYTSIYIPTLDKHKRTVWCCGQEDFLKLLDRWNYLSSLRNSLRWIYFS